MSQVFFNAGHLLPKKLRFKNGGAKLVSCTGRNLTSVRPFVTPWTLLKNPNFGACTWVNSFGHHTRFMTIGKDRNKDRFEKRQLCRV